jgi:hypothetical protein
VAALATATGCTPANEIPECPGVAVGTFSLRATRAAAACQGDTAPSDGDTACQRTDPAWVLGRCQLVRPVPSCCFDILFPPALPALSLTIAYAAVGPGAVACLPRPKASPFQGTRTTGAGGEQLSLALDTSGAVLGSCAAACAVTVHQTLTGLVARDPVSGLATGFTGEHVEVASATPAADCAPCVAPCTATWALTPAP